MWADFIEALTNTVINDSIYFYLLLFKLCGAVCPERNRTEKETNNEAYNNSGFCLCLFFFYVSHVYGLMEIATLYCAL